MIDTVAATWKVGMPQRHLESNFRLPSDGAGGRLYCNPSDFPAVNLSLYRRATGDWLRVQTSLPKLSYGSNVALIDNESELQRAMAQFLLSFRTLQDSTSTLVRGMSFGSMHPTTGK